MLETAGVEVVLGGAGLVLARGPSVDMRGHRVIVQTPTVAVVVVAVAVAVAVVGEAVVRMTTDRLLRVVGRTRGQRIRRMVAAGMMIGTVGGMGIGRRREDDAVGE